MKGEFKEPPFSHLNQMHHTQIGWTPCGTFPDFLTDLCWTSFTDAHTSVLPWEYLHDILKAAGLMFHATEGFLPRWQLAVEVWPSDCPVNWSLAKELISELAHPHTPIPPVCVSCFPLL